MTEQKDSSHFLPDESELPDWASSMPLDWRTLPIDEIQHRRFSDEHL